MLTGVKVASGARVPCVRMRFAAAREPLREDARRHPRPTGRDASPPKAASPPRRRPARRPRLGARRRAPASPTACIVATDSDEIARRGRAAPAARRSLTDAAHPSGTDRVAEVARARRLSRLRRDRERAGRRAVRRPRPPCAARSRMVTPGAVSARHRRRCAREPDVLAAPDVVKVVTRRRRARAVLLARADPVPARRARTPPSATRRVLQHIGVYAYTRDALAPWVALPVASARAHRAAGTAAPARGRHAPWASRSSTRTARGGIDTEEDLGAPTRSGLTFYDDRDADADDARDSTRRSTSSSPAASSRRSARASPPRRSGGCSSSAACA